MSDASAGEVFGGYTIIETISEGPIARLCRAERRATGERVLLRVLGRLASQDPQVAAALDEMRERFSALRIEHPAILRLIEMGEWEGQRYVAYEDFEGTTLDEFMREDRPTLREALRLAILITEGLDAIHSHRLAHGDLKPRNILVRRLSRNRLAVKIALSDLATSTSDAAVSIYGALVGTPKYMAPEQIMGKRVSPASDIFSLGVIFYEMFSGREPFPAEGPLGYLRKNVEESPRPLAVADSRVPIELSRVVEKMLDRDPTRRYRSAGSLLEDLERVELRLEGAPAQYPPPGADSALARPTAEAAPVSERSWRIVAVMALATSFLLALVVLWLVAARPPERRAASHAAGPQVHSQAMPARVPPPPSHGASATPERSAPAPGAETPPVTVQAAQPAERTRSEDENALLEKALREARDLLAANDVQAAIEKLAAARSRFTGPEARQRIAELTVEARLMAAEALAAQGRTDEAVAAFKTLAVEFPAVPASARAKERAAEILYRQATQARDTGQLGDALRLLENIGRDFAETDAGRKAQAELPALRARYAEALRTTQPDEAVEAMRRALAAAPDANTPDLRRRLAALLINRANQRLQQERYDECLQDLVEARSLDADANASARLIEPKALLGRARVLRQQADIAGAVAIWQQMKEKYPSASETALMMREMPDIVRIAKSGAADNAAILANLAEEDLAAGNTAGAREKMEKLIANHPTSPQAREAAKRLAGWEMTDALKAWRKGDFASATGKLEAIVAKYPGTDAAEDAARELARYRATPKDMVYVPGGPFTMGLSPEAVQALLDRLGIPPNTPLADRIMAQRLGREVHVGPFYIDRCEVTNAQYKAYIDATGARPPRSPTWVGNTIRKGYENYPVTGISWDEASAYANYAGKRLPTEAEWEKAARGADGRNFPWGNEFDKSKAVIAGDAPREVGSVPSGASPYGALDMIGNAQEWVQDEYRPYGDTTAGPAPSAGARMRVVRGAAWNEQDEFSALCTARWPMQQDSDDVTVGFRCARDVK